MTVEIVFFQQSASGALSILLVRLEDGGLKPFSGESTIQRVAVSEGAAWGEVSNGCDDGVGVDAAMVVEVGDLEVDNPAAKGRDAACSFSTRRCR